MMSETEQSAPVPDQVMMIRSLGGLTFPLVVKAALETGIFRAFKDGILSLPEIAAALELNEEALKRLFRAMELFGLIADEGKGLFRPTPFGATLMPGNPPQSVSALASFLLDDSTLKPMLDLSYSLRTGKPSLRQDEKEAWYAANPERTRMMDLAMEVYSGMTLKGIIAAYTFEKSAVIVDIAGGIGHMLAGLLRANPGTRGILLELPPTARRAIEYIQSQGLSERCGVVAGNMFEEVPGEGDIYLLSKTLNNWDDGHSVEILNSVRKAMKKGSKLLVVEMIRNELRPSPEEIYRDLMFLACSNGGKTRTLDEFLGLFNEAGLVFNRLVPVQGEFSLLECV